MTAPRGKVRVKCQGPGCGKTFWSASSRAKFCTPACRSRARRKPAGSADAPIMAATRAALGDQAATLNGQLALKVAEQIDKGTASVSLVRELQALVTKAVGKAPEPTPDPDATEPAEPEDEVARARAKAAAIREQVVNG